MGLREAYHVWPLVCEEINEKVTANEKRERRKKIKKGKGKGKKCHDVTWVICCSE
jgi:hypothetical protein